MATSAGPIAPQCRHFGQCGGCEWQHLAYADQLARKRSYLTELLHDVLGADAPPVPPVIGMRVDDSGWPWRFRQKASFVFGTGREGELTIGHYAARSREVVAITECPVHSDRANRVAFALHDHLARARVPAAGPQLRGVLRHLVVRTTRDGREVGAMLVVTANDRVLRKPIKAFLATEEAPDGFFLSVHDRPDPYMIGRDTIRLSGRSHVKETVDDVSYLLSPTAFFQTNVEAADAIVSRVVATVGDERPLRVLDLYAGSGLFTVPLAARGHRVTTVEENRQSIEDADANLRLNRVDVRAVRLEVARVEDALVRLRRERFDVVILDPPRQGAGAHAITGIFAELAPARVLYVSCNPEALRSELPLIMSHGYTLDMVEPIDMFPHTTHIECLLTFTAPDRPQRATMTARATAPRATPRARGPRRAPRARRP